MARRRNRFAQTYVFSTIGVILMAVLLVVLNFIGRGIGGRIDLSEDKLYTLSPATHEILGGLESPVTIRYYFSRNAASEAGLALQTYARQVENLLAEYKRIGGHNIVLEKYDPEPFSDAADSADLDGILGQDVGRGQALYFGISVNLLDAQQAIPFLHPTRRNLLEYDLTRAIHRVSNPRQQVVGVMSSLPVLGTPRMPMQMPGMDRGQEQPWQFVTELRKEYDVQRVATSTRRIDPDIDVLVLIHPQELSDETLFAVDQYLLHGGRILAFVDPMSTAESRSRDPMQAAQSPSPGSSTLGVLFDAWGIEFDTDYVVADLIHATRIRHPTTGEPISMPAILSLTSDAMSPDNPVTSQLGNVILAFSGIITGDAADGLDTEVLLETSERSDLVEKFRAQLAPDDIRRHIVESGTRFPLALRLSGRFPTAFPDGTPGADPEAVARDGSLTEAVGDGAVIVVADSDVVFDDFCVQRQRIFGQTVAYPISDNLTLAQNMVDQLAGGTALMRIRSRGAVSRPFKVINERQAEAEEQYRGKIERLENELVDVQQRLNELFRGQREQGEQQQFLTSEQLEMLESFRQKQVETRQELREVQKQLRRDINALENTLKWANIALMPLLVGLSGIVLAIIERRREVNT